MKIARFLLLLLGKLAWLQALTASSAISSSAPAVSPITASWILGSPVNTEWLGNSSLDSPSSFDADLNLRHRADLGLPLSIQASTAGDEFWWDGFQGTLTDDEVLCFASFQGDLYVGGYFTIVGGVPGTSRIARWDGNQWHSLLNGVAGTVRALAVYRSELIVAGDFLTSFGEIPTRKIVRWNGSTWLPLGIDNTSGDVYSLHVHGDSLIIGGTFTQISGIEANRIALWNGSSMQTLGPGFNNHVIAVEEWNGQIVAGGYFTASGATPTSRVAIWGGSSWSELGNGGLNASVRALEVHGSNLIAGGTFTLPGGSSALAQWDGAAWSSVGGGVNSTVTGLCSTLDGLYVVGYFTQAGAVSVNYIARWNDSSWDDVGGGIQGDRFSPWLSVVHETNGVIYAGGYFSQAGGAEAIHVAAWDGNGWDSTISNSGNGLYGSVGPTTMTVHQDELIAGGAFVRAAGQLVNTIASWNGVSWSGFGTGPDGTVDVVYSDAEKLYAGGQFTVMDGVPASNIAEWDGSDWHALGMGTNGTIHAVTRWNGDLYVGGNFTMAGGVPANNVARWDGMSWSALGSGVSNIFLWGVRCFQEYDNALIVGGDFQTAGGMSAKYIARWDGSVWSRLSTGMAGGIVLPGVHDLTIFNGGLIAGGDFATAGGVSAGSIASWNGSTWSPLGAGAGGRVYELANYGPYLISGGYVVAEGALRYIGAWNGTSWSSLGSGMEGWVDALVTYQGSLYAGGNFNWAGLKSSILVARWTDPAVASVPVPPQVPVLTASPNPFRAGTSLVYELALPGSYRLIVFDVAGRRVRTLVDRFMDSGSANLIWDGRDESGLDVGPGAYFLRLSGSSDSRRIKVIRLP